MSKMIEETGDHLFLFDEGSIFKFYDHIQTIGSSQFFIIADDNKLEGL